MSATIFIDGEAGTTGLQIRERLATRRDLTLLQLDEARRKDPAARREALNACDVAILCLPDEAAIEAVAMVENPGVKVIDASTAYRVAPDWVYGFAEMGDGQRAAIQAAMRVSNPGCYPTGFIALLKPLIDAGLVPADWPVTVNAVSGYSGGGKAMIAEFEDESAATFTRVPFRLYGLALGHKHVGEMTKHAGLRCIPLFAPSVGRYRQGMLVEVPLQLNAMPARPPLALVHEALAAHYAGARFVTVVSRDDCAAIKTLDPESLNHTNQMKLFVFGDEKRGQARLVALLDNLGKGASGAAVQNLNLMIGADEDLGL